MSEEMSQDRDHHSISRTRTVFRDQIQMSLYIQYITTSLGPRGSTRPSWPPTCFQTDLKLSWTLKGYWRNHQILTGCRRSLCQFSWQCEFVNRYICPPALQGENRQIRDSRTFCVSSVYIHTFHHLQLVQTKLINCISISPFLFIFNTKNEISNTMKCIFLCMTNSDSADYWWHFTGPNK